MADVRALYLHSLPLGTPKLLATRASSSDAVTRFQTIAAQAIEIFRETTLHPEPAGEVYSSLNTALAWLPRRAELRFFIREIGSRLRAPPQTQGIDKCRYIAKPRIYPVDI